MTIDRVLRKEIKTERYRQRTEDKEKEKKYEGYSSRHI